ncbi:MAG: alpha-amylase family glycosyl hydrolase [Bacillota bacterium]|nr:alpha-amylase family glycosyl hydrolase [Bacillota bacterium]
MKKFISGILVLCLTATVFLTGCTQQASSSGQANVAYKDPIEGVKATASTDKYRNYYEVFVNSFYDSNNDGTGDLNGLTQKLDYINDGNPNSGNDLGADGIWLMPIMSSPSYHKYDVTDYYNVDPAYGTLKDFDNLMSAAHKRGVKVILDLVINHCSSSLPLFKKACEELRNGDSTHDAKYFCFKQASVQPGGYKPVSGTDNWYYEANFGGEMPEWDLTQQCTRDEFKKIMKFWLDRGVDGFRLDAVKYYNDTNITSESFLTWLYGTAKTLKSDIYMVGEDWEGNAQISDNYKSGIDSLFNFPFSEVGGFYISAVRSNSGFAVSKMKNWQEIFKKSNPNGIDANFLSNHDQVRSASDLWEQLSMEKAAAALYMLFPGNSFTYYGEELGMTSISTDASKRTPMIWSTKNTKGITDLPPGVVDPNIPKAGSVETQLADSQSLLNYYRRIIKIKDQNPGIARGTITQVVDFGDINIGAYINTYQGKDMLIIHNLSSDTTKALKITDKMIKNPKIIADLVGCGQIDDGSGKKTIPHITLDSDGTLHIPPYSTAILATK